MTEPRKTTIAHWGITRELTVPADAIEAEDARAVRLMTSMIQWAQKNGNDSKAGPCKLKLKQATYLGTKHESWTDDSYYAIPYEGEPDAKSAERISAMFNGRQEAWLDEEKRCVIVRDSYSIGD